MGYGANFADVIEADTLKKICPKTYEAFVEALRTGEVELESFAQDIEHDAVDETSAMFKAYQELIDAFEKETDMSLGIGFHDADDQGDCYDEINGAFFWIDGMYSITPAGKKLKDRYGDGVERKFFVTFG
jgi:hypothetical protein